MNRIADASAVTIRDAFDQFHTQFKEITRWAKARFECRDWYGVQKDAAERLDLYRSVTDKNVSDIRALLGADTQNRAVWAAIKRYYSELMRGRYDCELAETYFNSVTRKIFTTVGVEPTIEFVASDAEVNHAETGPPIYWHYPAPATTAQLVKDILSDYPFEVGYEDIELDARLAAARIDAHLGELPEQPARIDSVDVLKPIFYRNKGAYLIGRIRSGGQFIPLIFPLLNGDGGVVVDAVLLTQDEASVIFSFTRSYFRVNVEKPRELIEFLKTIMPLKRVAELYISIGYNKHGKTELYRDLLRHLEHSDDKFEIARGKKGMVMSVFTLPSYDFVFKMIKDRFDPPKTTTRLDVMEKYNLVFKHDRAGRLVDTQEYEYLKFKKSRFSRELLDELNSVAANSVAIEDDNVIIKHVYTERRMIPLDLYVKEAPAEAACDAVVDYGNAIKDLAAANIFPGDTLLKNFGVTRHGRVVFYDYDELCLLTQCNFREIPAAHNYDDELESETWFKVNENDIFPSEFKTFLGLSGRLRELFIETHGELFGVDFWRNTQNKIRSGEVADIFPYKQSRRLRI